MAFWNLLPSSVLSPLFVSVDDSVESPECAIALVAVGAVSDSFKSSAMVLACLVVSLSLSGLS
jgi:hypothetical protein